MHHFSGGTAAKLYDEGLGLLRVAGEKNGSRNGPVIAMPDVTAFTLYEPRARVLDDPIRRANPFFHMMEFIWMMAGERKVKWISQFNKRMKEYSNEGQVMAAYGYRWRKDWGDQLYEIISKLAKDPNTRQAVLQMWNPEPDLYQEYKDKACNTSMMFRYTRGALDCLVTNRSNDFIWGALGANICHLTMLHETVAHFAGLPLGKYTVVSNNLHVYTEMPRFNEIFQARVVEDVYRTVDPNYMFVGGDTYDRFVDDCSSFVASDFDSIQTPWLTDTAFPAYLAWTEKKPQHIAHIEQDDWRIACANYVNRKTSLSATSTEPSL